MMKSIKKEIELMEKIDDPNITEKEWTKLLMELAKLRRKRESSLGARLRDPFYIVIAMMGVLAVAAFLSE